MHVLWRACIGLPCHARHGLPPTAGGAKQDVCAGASSRVAAAHDPLTLGPAVTPPPHPPLFPPPPPTRPPRTDSSAESLGRWRAGGEVRASRRGGDTHALARTVQARPLPREPFGPRAYAASRIGSWVPRPIPPGRVGVSGCSREAPPVLPRSVNEWFACGRAGVSRRGAMRRQQGCSRRSDRKGC